MVQHPGLCGGTICGAQLHEGGVSNTHGGEGRGLGAVVRDWVSTGGGGGGQESDSIWSH